MKKQIRTHKENTLERKSGFSLIEILIAVAIIAMIVAATIGGLEGIFGSNQEKIAKIFVAQTLKTALVPYRLDVGNYPSNEEGLNALVKAPAGKENKWKGPYLEAREVPADPWGNPYKYRFPGTKNVNGARGYDVWSLGPDGVESADDIGNW
jgi:general secretion pathway protein G